MKLSELKKIAEEVEAERLYDHDVCMKFINDFYPRRVLKLIELLEDAKVLIDWERANSFEEYEKWLTKFNAEFGE